jgi:hypothetical protein
MRGVMSSRWGQLFSILGAMVLGLAWYGFGVVAPGVAAANSGPDKLYKHEYALIALSRLRGDKDVVILVAARTGRIAEAVEEFTKLGGEVHFRADDVDYLRGRLPVDKVVKLSLSSSVESLDIDVDVDRFNPEQDFPPEAEKPSSVPPDPDTPLSHPYLPQKDMDIVDFQAEHSTYDGRGVGMAILDATPDILAPELQRATALDGQPVRKISELLASTDPRDDTDPMWVKMDKQVRAEGGKFTVDNMTYTAPADGEYRFGNFNERDLKQPAYLHQDVNFDGNPEGSSGLFAVLWNEKTGTVWVDTDQDHSFQNERALQDYARRGDIGIFGSNRPPQPRRHTVGFAVQTDPQKHYVRLTLGVWQHVTEVSGATIGKGFYGGSYNGIAGEAQLVIYFTGASSMYRRVESVIEAARNPKVDVICLEPAVMDEVTDPLHDGKLVAGVIFDRVTEKYKKPLLSPANNTFGMTTVIDEVSSHGILAVGAYQAGEAYRINNGAEVAHHDNLHLVGSFGPSGDGSLKPDIISPSELISTDCGYKPPEKVKGIYELPPGYSVAGGTSTAGPSASAAVALLISAAKQSKIHYDEQRIRAALISSARFLPAYQAYQQGNGLVQVNGAWKILQELDKKWDPVTIKSRASVKTENAQYLNPPFQGPGIFEREGWAPGQSGTRTVTFTRLSGKAEPVTFRLEWVGNNGAFESADRISLPLNKPVELPITIQTKEPGVYSAILNLKRADDPGIAYQVLNTVVAAYDFNETNNFSVEIKTMAERPGTVSNFYRVPPGTSSLHVHLAIPNKKPTLRVEGFAPDRSTKLKWDFIGTTEKGFLDKVIPNPTPGVWEIELWDNNFVFMPDQIDSKPLAAVPANLTVSIDGLKTSQPFWNIPPAVLNTPHSEQIGFTNSFAPVIAEAHSFPLGSAYRATKTIAAGEQQTFDLDLPDGADNLTVRIGDASDSHADLDLYVFQKAKDIMVLRAKSDTNSSTETVVLDHPTGGKWQIVVDAFRVPRGSTQYKYEDVYFHSALGSISVDDKEELRPRGANWNVTAKVTVRATPVGERVLTGTVPIISRAKEGEPQPSAAIPSLNPSETSPPVAIGAASIEFEKSQ